MEDFVAKAVEKIEGGVSSVKDRYGKVVARPVEDALISFCRQQGEFAQAVVQSDKGFADCIAHVVKGIGQSLSDLEAYRKAVGFWFPGAVVDMVLSIRMSEYEEPAPETATETVPDVLPEGPEKRLGPKIQTTGELNFSLLDLL